MEDNVFTLLVLPQGGGKYSAQWSLVSGPLKGGGTPVSGSRSLLGEGKGEGVPLSWFWPGERGTLVRTGQGYAPPPDTTGSGQDTLRAVHLLRLRRRTVLLKP